MAKRRARTTRRTTTRTRHTATQENPSIVIQLGVIFIIVAAMLLAGYVGGLYMK